MKIYRLYLSLLKKYGRPEGFWKKWCKIKKTKEDREEIAIGAILTQRTNWQNVELALKNLKRTKILSIKGVYQMGQRNLKFLENLLRPSGFYRQKANRLFKFSEFIIKNYGSLEEFFKQDLVTSRQKLLQISGLGLETADSILLYAGNKPIFVIDEYTRRFVKKHRISDILSYQHLQQLFQQNLSVDVKLYQDFHAMIILEGKRMNWDLVSKNLARIKQIADKLGIKLEY